MKFAIIAIGYNRTDDFRRLVKSICDAEYYGDTVDLIASIDNSGSDAVENAARSVTWNHGEYIIRTFPERQGLRKHILSCGDFLDKYDAVAVFEDDLIVSPAFYNYMRQAVEKYHDNDTVAGISLYTHLRNQHAKYPFIPQVSPYDVFFIQCAQSWGQVWMKNQWNAFKDWYEKKSDGFEISSKAPQQLLNWGENSWLKYHILYCIEENKYFVYPYQSLTTCFCDAGEHSMKKDNVLHVPMQIATEIEYRLPQIEDNDVVLYDSFFERMGLGKYIGVEDESLTTDLYNLKKEQVGETKYLLSTGHYPYKVIREFDRSLRPQELNIIFNIEGKKIFLYDTDLHAEPPQEDRKQDIDTFTYFHNLYGNTKILIKTACYNLISNKKIRN